MIKTQSSYGLIEKLYMKNRNFCSEDYDDCLAALSKHCPFKIHTYSKPVNHWEIPPKWDLICAEIYKDHQLIYSVDHPLKIMGLSKAVDQTVTLKELKQHLHYDHRFEQAIPYHFRQFYRPWDRDWGFCVPKCFYDALLEGEYQVRIQTREAPGCLKVAEHRLQGKLDKGFVFLAHLDHPGMANDDLAGVACGIELFKRLAKKQLKFTYSLILIPEIIGSEFFLHTLPQQRKRDYLGGCFLEMLASKTPLALQESYEKNSYFEGYLEEVMHKKNIPHRKGVYKTIICNDETVWQSHQIPICSLSRFPYPEYHTSLDHPSILSEEKFEETVEILEKSIEELENEKWIQKHFVGTPNTAHPSLSLYVDAGQMAFGTSKNQEKIELRNAMDFLLAEKSLFPIRNILKRSSLCEKNLLSYLNKWEEKKLLTLY